jgi:3'-5' exoribonuclease
MRGCMLSEVKIGQQFELTVYISSAGEKISKNGKKYITGDLRDKSMVCKYYLWDSDNVASSIPVAETYAIVSGRLESFNGASQVNIISIKNIDQDLVDPHDFKKTSIKNVDSMWNELLDLVNTFSNPIVKYISEKLIKDPNVEKMFRTSPAAKSVHNAWAGGLIEHCLATAKFTDFLVKFYNKEYFDGKLDRDIAVFSALFHDIGKIWEYDSSTPEIKHTSKGELLGHIYMGAKKIEQIADEYLKLHNNEKTVSEINKIVHIVLAHHGKLEWGAPVNPKTPEAIILHYLDNLDTKIMNAWENISMCKDENEFTERIYVQENSKLLNILKKS